MGNKVRFKVNVCKSGFVVFLLIMFIVRDIFFCILKVFNEEL